MAQSLRRPLTSVGLLSSRLESQCFCTTSRWHAAPRQLGAQQPRRSPEKSVKLAAAQNQRIVSDLGLLPETFINPSGSNRPSIFRAPRDAWELLWERFTRKIKDLGITLVYKYTAPKGSRPKLQMRQVGPTAVGLHTQMYTAFAEGDKQTLQKICCDGLKESFLARLGARGKDSLKWELVSYHGRPKVMSHRAATLGIEGAGIRQAVVKIASTQRLTRLKPDGSVYDGSGKAKDVVEYFVIQKMSLNHQEENWKVWGTTEETTIESLRASKLQMLSQ